MKNPNESNSEIKLFGLSLNLQTIVVGIVLLVVGLGVGLLLGNLCKKPEQTTQVTSGGAAAGGASAGSDKPQEEAKQQESKTAEPAAAETAATEPALKSDDPIRDGKAAFEKRDYALALKYFDLALGKDATKAEGYHWRGIVYASSQLPETAIKEYDESLKLSPDSVAFHLDRAAAFYALRDYENAVEDYDAILKIEPSNNDALLGRAIANNAQKMYEPALNDLSRITSRNAKSYQLQGDVNLALRRYGDALQAYDQALQLAPNNFDLRSRKARVYLVSGQTKKAVENYGKLSRERPWRGDIGNDEGYAEICVRDYYGALNDLFIAKQSWASRVLTDNIKYASVKLIEQSLKELRRGQNVARNYARLAFGYLNLPDLQSAEKYAAQSVHVNPRDQFAWYILGSCQQDRQQYQSALESFEKAVALNPKYASAVFHVAMCANDLEKNELAIEKYKEFLRLEKDAVAYVNMSLSYIHLEKYDEADQALNAGLELDPRNTHLMANRAKILEKKDDYIGALEWLNRALAEAPENSDLYQNRALAYFQQNECDLALKDARKALLLNPNDSYAQYSLLMILAAVGTADEMIKEAKIGMTQFKPTDRDYLFAASMFPWYAYTWAGDSAEANKCLEYGLKRQTRGTKWPYALVEYLAGRKTKEEVLAATDDNGERTEAHTWFGVVLLQRGEKQKAIEEFKWVKENGIPTFLEASLAKAMLKRASAEQTASASSSSSPSGAGPGLGLDKFNTTK